MKDINKRIKESRPHLSKVSPLAYRLCQGFVGTNFLIGTLLLYFAERDTDALPLFGHIITFEVWAAVFTLLATAMLIGLVNNNWKLTKGVLIAGLFVKVFWTLSLAVLAATGSCVIDITILWLFLAWAQGWTIVHFLPVIGLNGIDEKSRQEG